MKMVSTIAIIVLCIMLTISSIICVGLYGDNKKLVVKNQLLSELYDVSIKNVESLERTIEEQNEKIDGFKSESIAFEQRVKELNTEVVKLNEEREEYIQMDDKKGNSSEEAMQWLKEQAPSL